jgi:hypothetical protein
MLRDAGAKSDRRVNNPVRFESEDCSGVIFGGKAGLDRIIPVR